MSNQNTNQSNLERTNTNNANTTRILLDFYITLHNQTVRRMDSLYDILDETRETINILGGINASNNNANRARQYSNDTNTNTYTNPYYIPSENNTRGNFRGRQGGEQAGRHQQGRGRYNNGRTNGGRNNISTNRSQNWHSMNYTTGQPNNFESLYNNRIYIEGRPYRIEFDRYTIPTPNYSYTNRNSGPETDLLNFIQQVYSNVPVVATAEQIERGTRIIRFSEIMSPTNNNCPITLEPFANDSTVTQILGCNHIFNTEAINSWFETNVRCPMCRYDVRTNIPSSSEREETKEELELEETKEEPQSFTPIVGSRERPVERNSNSIRSPRIQTYPSVSDGSSNNILESALTEITGNLINQFLNSTQRDTANRLFFNNSFDASNNEIIFRGFRI